jgi:hypothetical protein
VVERRHKLKRSATPSPRATGCLLLNITTNGHVLKRQSGLGMLSAGKEIVNALSVDEQRLALNL